MPQSQADDVMTSLYISSYIILKNNQNLHQHYIIVFNNIMDSVLHLFVYCLNLLHLGLLGRFNRIIISSTTSLKHYTQTWGHCIWEEFVTFLNGCWQFEFLQYNILLHSIIWSRKCEKWFKHDLTRSDICTWAAFATKRYVLVTLNNDK